MSQPTHYTVHFVNKDTGEGVSKVVSAFANLRQRRPIDAARLIIGDNARRYKKDERPPEDARTCLVCYEPDFRKPGRRLRLPYVAR